MIERPVDRVVVTRVGVTRPAAGAGALADRLRRAGYEPIVVPTIDARIDPRAVDELTLTLAEAVDGTWLVVTSPIGARAAAEALAGLGSAAPTVHVGAVGPSTARRLRDAGVEVDVVPDRFDARSLGEALATTSGSRAILALSSLASTAVEDELRLAGWQIRRIDVYRTVARTLDADAVASLAGCDVLTMTSGSAARSLAAAVPDRTDWPPCVCLGAETARAVAEAGFTVAAVADPATIDGLVAGIGRIG